MRYLFILGLLFSSSLVFAQKASSKNYETMYMQALELVYNQDSMAAMPLLEDLYDQIGTLQVAETLADVYSAYIEVLARGDNRQNIEEEYSNICSRLTDMLQKYPEQTLFRNALKSAFLVNDLEFSGSLADIMLAQDPENITANGIKAFSAAQKNNNPDEIIAAYAKIARSEASDAEEESLIAQARMEMARAYQMKGLSRSSLKYTRLSDLIRKTSNLQLATLEFFFLNFPYAVKQIENLNLPAHIFAEGAERTFYLGALFAEGSAESLKKMDALISANQNPSPYEEALSLHRRGINPRALRTLKSLDDPFVQKLYPWLYLNLYYKILSSLEDKENLIPVAESMGGQAYLLDKPALALSYLTNLTDGDKGELSYLLGTLYFKEKNYEESRRQMLKHLKDPDAKYKAQALSKLVDISFQVKDYKNAEKYISLYEKSEGSSEAAVSRGLLALKNKDYAGAKDIFSQYLSQLYGENARKTAAYQIASLYLEEWLKTHRNEDILLPEASVYTAAAYDIVRKQQEFPTTFFDLNVYNLYAYCYALSSKGSNLPQAALEAAEYIARLSPNPAFLDTAAVAFFEAGDIGDKSRGAEFYFTALEKEMALMDQEIEYCKQQAPPFFDRSSEKDAQYYEIYLHLAAWYNYSGKAEAAAKAAGEGLRLAEDKELAQAYLENLQKKWEK